MGRPICSAYPVADQLHTSVLVPRSQQIILAGCTVSCSCRQDATRTPHHPTRGTRSVRTELKLLHCNCACVACCSAWRCSASCTHHEPWHALSRAGDSPHTTSNNTSITPRPHMVCWCVQGSKHTCAVGACLGKRHLSKLRYVHARPPHAGTHGHAQMKTGLRRDYFYTSQQRMELGSRHACVHASLSRRTAGVKNKRRSALARGMR